MNDVTSQWDYSVSLQPFSSEARWVGNIDQLNDVLSHLVYYPKAQSLYSNVIATDDDSKEYEEAVAVIPDYVVTIVTKDGNTDAAEISRHQITVVSAVVVASDLKGSL